MERIEALIQQLNEQYRQKADTSQLLGTVQLIQFELSKLQSIGQHTLGTAKVAVVLPIAQSLGMAAGYEKYAPRPAALMPEVTTPEPVKERKEAKETKHWLRMVAHASPDYNDDCRRLWKEAQELTLIFSAITNKKK